MRKVIPASSRIESTPSPSWKSRAGANGGEAISDTQRTSPKPHGPRGGAFQQRQLVPKVRVILPSRPSRPVDSWVAGERLQCGPSMTSPAPKQLSQSSHGLHCVHPEGDATDAKTDDSMSVSPPPPAKTMEPSPSRRCLTTMLKEPEGPTITNEQLVAEVKGIYTGLAMVEAKCVNIDAAKANEHERQSLSPDQWQARTALHQTLLYEHHDFLLVTQHPSATDALKNLAVKYSMPARVWKHSIHAFLKVLRHRRPDSQEYMLQFIYFAWSMMALRRETVPYSKDTWIECLGDLARYRMAIEFEDKHEAPSLWQKLAAQWYDLQLDADRDPIMGSLNHHLETLERLDLRSPFFYTKSLSCEILFQSARESLTTACNRISTPASLADKEPQPRMTEEEFVLSTTPSLPSILTWVYHNSSTAGQLLQSLQSTLRIQLMTMPVLCWIPRAHGHPIPPQDVSPAETGTWAGYEIESVACRSVTALIIMGSLINVTRIYHLNLKREPKWTGQLAVGFGFLVGALITAAPESICLRDTFASMYFACESNHVVRMALRLRRSRLYVWLTCCVGILCSILMGDGDAGSLSARVTSGLPWAPASVALVAMMLPTVMS